MPLDLRTVEPVYLGRRPLRPEEADDGDAAQTAVLHNGVVGALCQLASLVRHADDVFCDLSEECQKLCNRAERIARKVENISHAVTRLDSKKVKIPVGDLRQFSKVTEHHVAKHGFNIHLFTAETRPHCIQELYNHSDVTPAKLLCGADIYRKDGLNSALLFRLWPVVFNEHRVSSPDLNLPRVGPPLFSYTKPYKRLKVRERERRKTIHISKDIVINNEEEEGEEDPASVSDSEAPIPVPIDTSGSSFYRMESLRKSFTESEGGTGNRKRRRRTVSGVPEAEAILRELKSFEKSHKTRESGAPRNAPRPYSFDELNPVFQVERDEAMAQYFSEVDALIEEREEEERSRKEFKLLKFLPCRRSRSLPRCVKLQPPRPGAEHTRLRGSGGSTGSGSFASSLSLASLHSAVSSHASRASKRSSLLGSKLRSLVSGGASSKARPKSLDLESLCAETAESEAQLSRRASPSMPDNLGSDTRRRSQVGPGTYYYFESNTLPRAQARKYDFPWESLPKDWTTSVKMREISKRRSLRDDRQSSSGNWSASSCSNRQSVESGKSSMPSSSASQHSLGKDSGRDSPTPTEGGRPAAADWDTEAGEARSHFTKMDTDAWLQSLARRAASREDVAASSSALQTLSSLTRQNIRALDLMSPALRGAGVGRLEDEESEYSVDQEGFYTSFHTDSGLRHSTGTLIDGEEDVAAPRAGGPEGEELGEEEGEEPRPVPATPSLLSMGSTATLDSVIFRPLPPSSQPSPRREGGAPGPKKEGGKVPPPPPPRVSSVSSVGEVLGEEGGSSDGSSPPSLQAQDKEAAAESDQETVSARLKLKTQFSPQAFPSLCTVSSTSDEDSTPPQSREQLFLKDGGPAARPTDIPLASCLSNPPLEGSLSGKALGTVGEGGSQGCWEAGTLPRRYVACKQWEEEDMDYSNSWPRDGRKSCTPGAGILKTDKTTSLQRPSKTLNFAPMVNMFDPGLTQTVQMPLPSLSSSSSSCDESANGLPSSRTLLSPDRGSYKLAVPDARERVCDDSREAAVPLKYQPTITVTPRARPQHARPHKEGAYVKMVPSDNSGSQSVVVYPSRVRPGGLQQNTSIIGGAAGAGDPGACTSTPTDGSSDLSSQQSGSDLSIPSLSSSVTSSVTSSMSSSEGGFGDARNAAVAQHSDAASNGSSLIFSDFDSSLTCISPTTPSSTRSNSTLTLTPTPTDSEAASLADSGRGEQETSSADSTPTNLPRRRRRAERGQEDLESFLRVEAAPPSAPPFSTFSSSPALASLTLRPNVALSPVSADTGLGDSSPSPDSVEWTAAAAVARKGGVPHSSTWHGSSPASRQDKVALTPSPSLTLSQSASLPRNNDNSRAHPRKSSTKAERRKSSPGDSRLSLNSTLSMTSVSEGASLSSSQSSLASSSRSDSYRVAMLSEVGQPQPPGSSRADSYRLALGRQQSAPPVPGLPPPPLGLDPAAALDVSRADSYRLAVRNTNGVVSVEAPERQRAGGKGGDASGRNCSYRLALQQQGAAPQGDSRLDALNQWDGAGSGSRDFRRMGITDVDQLKCYDSAPLKTGTTPHFSSSSSSSKPNKPKGLFATINSYNKKVNIKRDIEALLKPDAVSSGTKAAQGRNSGTPRDRVENRSKVKDRPLSSTYVSFDPFDPILEDGDDSLNSSSDTVRAAPTGSAGAKRRAVSQSSSREAATSGEGSLVGHKIAGEASSRGRRSGSWVGGRREDKPASTLLGSLKTTLKSISGRKSERDDDWKYETGV